METPSKERQLEVWEAIQYQTKRFGTYLCNVINYEDHYNLDLDLTWSEKKFFIHIVFKEGWASTDCPENKGIKTPKGDEAIWESHSPLRLIFIQRQIDKLK